MCLAELAFVLEKIKTGSVPGVAAWVGDRVEGRNKHKIALSTRPPFWELGTDRHSLYRTLLQEFKFQVGPVVVVGGAFFHSLCLVLGPQRHLLIVLYLHKALVQHHFSPGQLQE